MTAYRRSAHEVVSVLGYHRKYAIQALNEERVRKMPGHRTRPTKYHDALPAIRVTWEVLHYPCAERLQPVLAPTAKLLAQHGELQLPPSVLDELTRISRATLARRLIQWRLLKPRCTVPHRNPGSSLLSEVVEVGDDPPGQELSLHGFRRRGPKGRPCKHEDERVLRVRRELEHRTGFQEEVGPARCIVSTVNAGVFRFSWQRWRAVFWV